MHSDRMVKRRLKVSMVAPAAAVDALAASSMLSATHRLPEVPRMRMPCRAADVDVGRSMAAALPTPPAVAMGLHNK